MPIPLSVVRRHSFERYVRAEVKLYIKREVPIRTPKKKIERAREESSRCGQRSWAGFHLNIRQLQGCLAYSIARMSIQFIYENELTQYTCIQSYWHCCYSWVRSEVFNCTLVFIQIA